MARPIDRADAGPSGPEPGSDGWNQLRRSEGPLRRADRNFAELLQELRVVLTGVQILLGFLLSASFTDRFTQLDPLQRGIFLTTLVAATLSSMLLVAPVAAHRVVFRRGRKPELVRWAHHLTRMGLGTLAVTLASGLVLVLDLATGTVGAIVGGAAFVVVLVLLWVVVPSRMLS